jgi:hypothetical protein
MAVKRSLNKRLTSLQLRKGWGLPIHWGGGELIVAAILIVGILSLGSGMFGRWINSAGEGGLLPVPLHSLGEADYGVDEITRPVPAIGLEIIQDLLGIEEPPETGGLPEVALITPSDPSTTPTPTTTIIGVIPWTATPTENNINSATATPGPRQSATPFQTVQATPTPTWVNRSHDTPIPTSTQGKSATSIPMPTQIPPTATAQVPATSTPLPSQLPPAPATSTPLPSQSPPAPATSTPLPSQLPPPTSMPNPSPTPPQVTSTAPRPTRSSTQAITPTAHYTPAVMAETPSLP